MIVQTDSIITQEFAETTPPIEGIGSLNGRFRRIMEVFSSAENFLCVLVIGILQESGCVTLIYGFSTFV